MNIFGGEDTMEIVEDFKTHQGSSWGNDFIRIGDEELEALKQGKILFHFDGEYGHYIKYEKENNDDNA